jgi:hypothetical protein
MNKTVITELGESQPCFLTANTQIRFSSLDKDLKKIPTYQSLRVKLPMKRLKVALLSSEKRLRFTLDP